MNQRMSVPAPDPQLIILCGMAIGQWIDEEKVVLWDKTRVKSTSVIDGEYSDLYLKTGVLFSLTVLPPQPP